MKNIQEEEGGWKLSEAFEVDTRSTIWPPRSYTCSFCRREFRSAQALGGHMNVHRRDRARIHQQAQAQAQTLEQYQSTILGQDPFLSWANDVGFGVVGNKEMSLFYQLGNNNNHNLGQISSFVDSSIGTNMWVNDEMQVTETLTEVVCKENEVVEPVEELDLELRLGYVHVNKIR